jgi:hypothetical protein
MDWVTTAFFAVVSQCIYSQKVRSSTQEEHP